MKQKQAKHTFKIKLLDLGDGVPTLSMCYPADASWPGTWQIGEEVEVSVRQIPTVRKTTIQAATQGRLEREKQAYESGREAFAGSVKRKYVPEFEGNTKAEIARLKREWKFGWDSARDEEPSIYDSPGSQSLVPEV